MPDKLECVATGCDTKFDPEPNGGFCPDCDVPHPEYDPADDGEDTGDAPKAAATADTGSAGDDSGAESFEEWAGENAGTEHTADSVGSTDDSVGDADSSDDPFGKPADASASEEADSADDSLDEADSSDDPFGKPADASASEAADSADDSLDEADSSDDPFGKPADASASEAADATGDDESEPDPETAAEVTLLVNGNPYRFGDGDTFGRQDEDYLEDLVTACGDPDEASYVSGDHLEFSVRADGIYVIDVSTNGTSHNGTALDGGEAKLEDGDTLELAERVTIDVQVPEGIGEPVSTDDAASESAAQTESPDAEPASEEASAGPEEVTLLVNGNPYRFGDGDTFGRQDEDYLEDLVTACGDPDEASYVSGDHLEFSVRADGIYVIDVSTNGTSHNGTALDGGEAKLEDGDTLELAERVTIDVEC